MELDFINEGHNAELISANFGPREDIIVPEDHVGVQHPSRADDGIPGRHQDY